MSEQSSNGNVEHEVAPETETSRQVARVKAWLRTLGPIVLAVVSALTAYKGADGKTGEVKNQAEAGFQQNKNRTHEQEVFNEGIRNDVQKLKEEVAELKRRQIRPVKRQESAKTAAVAAVPAPTPPPPLPSAPIAPTLDKALEQIQQQQRAPEPAPPAAPPK
jgi:hypothetical protein